MCKTLKKYKSFSALWVFMSLAFCCNTAYSQYHSENALNRISPEILGRIIDDISLSPERSMSEVPFSIISGATQVKDRNVVFYDTLKAKASKNNLTKKLYSFIIVRPDTIFKKQFTVTSDASFIEYSGKKIRKIVIQRLNVFGADINNPSSNNPDRIENLLNKTHINTNENIIRKNLLFSEGEKISPLILSDNERILRQLPFIDDARIVVVPVSDEEADIIVYTRDVYSLGGTYTFKGMKKGSLSIFDKNIFGMGHEFGIDMPYDSNSPDSPGFGVHYIANNIAKSFINLNAYYLYGLGEKTYGFDLSRKLVSSTTKYAGGISIRQMYTSEDLDTLPVPAPLKYNLQDYWLSRSFLINKAAVSRIIIGARYTNNNVFDHPFILPESFYNLQRYKIFLASAAFSIQKYTKTNLIYSYGRTEDIPYGSLFKITAGREFNEFKERTYIGGEISCAKSVKTLGYFYTYTGLSTYLNKNQAEQGILSLGMNYFSNLINLGNSKIRNFVYFQYTRGINRYTNEFLCFPTDNGFSGFSSDSVKGKQRLSISLESVLFSPINLYGFRFAFFGFTDLAFLSGTNEIIGRDYTLSSIGIGIRIRNDNMVFNTLQIRICYFPNPPGYSTVNSITVSGEQLLRPANFEPGPPSIIPYR